MASGASMEASESSCSSSEASDWWSDSSASFSDHSSSSDESTSAQPCRWDLGDYTHHGADSSDEARRESWQPTAAMVQRAAKLYKQRVAELQAFSNQRKLHPAPTSTASASSANLRQTRAGMDVCFEKMVFSITVENLRLRRFKGRQVLLGHSLRNITQEV